MSREGEYAFVVQLLLYPMEQGRCCFQLFVCVQCIFKRVKTVVLCLVRPHLSSYVSSHVLTRRCFAFRRALCHPVVTMWVISARGTPWAGGGRRGKGEGLAHRA